LNHFLAALPLLLSAAVSQQGQAATVRDDLGQTVHLPAPARRIVTLSPHATELVIAAGAGDRLVGVAPGSPTDDRSRALPLIGGPGGMDRELLLGMRPDLVIGWQSGNRARDLDWIAAAGIALYRSEPLTLQDIAAGIRRIGLLSDTPEDAEHAAVRFEQSLHTPCAALPLQPVYVSVWEHPPMTVGGRHWINAVLEAAGYRNRFAGIKRGVFPVGPEAAHADRHLPRISLVRDRGDPGAEFLADTLSRPGPRLPWAIELLCARRLAEARTR